MSQHGVSGGSPQDLIIPGRFVFAIVALGYAGLVSSGAVLTFLLIRGFGIDDILSYAIVGAILWIAYYPVLLIWIERMGSSPRYGFSVHCAVTLVGATVSYAIAARIFG